MPELTRRQVALTLAAVGATLALAVGLYGLITGPRPDHASGTSAATVKAGQSADIGAIAAATAGADPSAKPLLQTNDPLIYARAVASALFDWDTASGYLPADYQAPVLADADPSGTETAGLIADVATYLPTTEQWLDLATMNVTQTLHIASAEVPSDWQAILAESHGQLPPGTTAVTITGTRERTGTWNHQPAYTSAPTSFTVFVACRPAFPRCHVLRLSQLDNPLR